MPPLRLFGVPRWVHDDHVLTLPATRPVALLAYLARRVEWVARDEAALLFWPESDEPRASHALRQVVYRARRFPWATGLEVTDHHLRWRVESDALEFRRCLDTSDWAGAIAAYGGRFLEGLELADAPGFDAWLEVERDEFRRGYLEATLRAAAAHELDRDYEAAAGLLRAAWPHDPLAEELVHALIRCLALAGRPAAAVEAFDGFSTELRSEMGLEPSEAMRELVRRVRSGAQVAPRPHNLPRQATSFVGRAGELREVARRLADPDCRLLTLTGPGGIGKTRLALQAAGHQIGAFRHGVFLVPLVAVSGASAMMAAVANALGSPLPQTGAPEEGLLTLLGDREVLLLLDGLEHLQEENRWLAELLARAPGVTVLATSREPLDLAAEWSFPLEGLELPRDGAAATSSSSVRLFVQRAERVRPGFALGPDNGSDVARVCRLVAGVPLAIELAAGWVQLLTPTEIACKIERDLDFLRSELGDTPARHQSLRTVFESSWARAGEAERELAMRLSVFVGDVALETVEAVAGHGLPVLMALVKRSFVRRNPAGRFEMHELVRQYVREKLAERPGLAREAELLHARHVAELVSGWSPGAEEGAAARRPQRLLPDAERAWATLVELREWTALVAMLPSLFEAHDLWALSRRYLEWIEAALRADPEDAAVRGRLLAHRAACLQRLGRYAEAEGDAQACLALLPPEPPAFEQLVAQRARGNAAYLRGDHGAALASFHEALAVAERLGQRRFTAGCLNNLGLVYKETHDLERALAHLRRARSLTEGLDDTVHSQVLNNLATVQARRGDLEEAERLLIESAALKRRLGDDRGLASVYANLGNLCARAGDLEEAERLHRDSLRLAEAIGDPSGVARGHTNLGDLALRAGDPREAIAAYRRCLELKRVLDERSGAVQAYAQLVACHRALGDLEAGRAVAEEGLEYARGCGRQELIDVMAEAAGAVGAPASSGLQAPLDRSGRPDLEPGRPT